MAHERQAGINIGSAWAGPVPADWGVVRLKYLSTIYSGGTPDRENKNYWDDGTVPWLNSGEVNQWLISEPSTFITDEGFRHSSAKWIPAGALVMALAGQGKTKGMVAQLAIASTCNQSMAAIVPSKRVHARFVQWWLHANYETIRNLAGGEQRDGLNLEIVGNVPCPQPSVLSQSAIADYLDRETARLDALVAVKERVLGLLAEKRRVLITRAVTRGLDPRAPLRDSGVPWLGEIPAHWEAMRLKRLVAIPITDGPHETPEFAEDGIDFISAEAIQDDAIEFERRRGFITRELHAEYCRKTRPQREDILFCKSGATTGKLARVTVDHEFSIWSPLAVIRADLGRTLPGYLEISLRADIVQDQVRQTWSAGTQPNISMGAINELWLAVPPITEQAEILATLNIATNQFDKIKSATVRTVALLKERRAALIAAAVTGQLQVA